MSMCKAGSEVTLIAQPQNLYIYKIYKIVKTFYNTFDADSYTILP